MLLKDPKGSAIVGAYLSYAHLPSTRNLYSNLPIGTLLPVEKQICPFISIFLSMRSWFCHLYQDPTNSTVRGI